MTINGFAIDKSEILIDFLFYFTILQFVLMIKNDKSKLNININFEGSEIWHENGINLVWKNQHWTL